jgi:hypothetical protein
MEMRPAGKSFFDPDAHNAHWRKTRRNVLERQGFLCFIPRRLCSIEEAIKKAGL